MKTGKNMNGSKMKINSNLIISIVLTAIVAMVSNYLLLPAWNIKSASAWLFVVCILGVFYSILFLTASLSFDEKESSIIKTVSISASLLILVVLLGALFFGSRLFNSKKYSTLISTSIKEGNIKDYKATIDNVPLLDKDSSMLISNRKLGGLIDVVSQFEIEDTEQITVKGKPIRVSILEYGSFFKWVNNKNTGTPGYIKIDMKTQDAELVRIDGGIKYSPSEYFGRDLKRYLRFNFPTLMFSQPTLELSEDGHPYWISPIIDHTIGLFGGKDVIGAITVDASTGELKKYDIKDIPDWLDNVYDSDLIMNQYDDYGSLQGGFWNSMFGQKGVKVTTEGYNYIPQNNDNYMYTGITSSGKDESNIGFIISNKRTKETIYYPQSGAEEFSAMSSAEGMVQDLAYKATFPLLLNIEGQPTYMVALKDAAGLVKLYSLINVEKYQLVAIGDTIQSCQSKYRELLKSNGTKVIEAEKTLVQGKIGVIKEATKQGTTYYYIKLENNEKYYVFSIVDNEEIILLKVGDTIKLNSEIKENKTILSATLIK